MIRIAEGSLRQVTDRNATEESGDNIVTRRCLIHGGLNHEKIWGRIMHSHSAGSFASQSIRASRSTFPTGGSHGSSPATPAPVTPPTFPRSEGKAEPDRADARVYMGTIVRDGDTYVLKAGNAKYLLDSQKKAKTYKGKDVNVTGTLDKGEKFDSR